jgi:hypothetical protein
LVLTTASVARQVMSYRKTGQEHAYLGNGTCSYHNVLQRVLKEGFFP